jgi:uncharacterized protein YjbI with pentapeptide repeats
MPGSLEKMAEDLAVRDGDTLSEVELRGARWAGIHVSGLRVHEALLAGCDLSDAALTGPEFTDTILLESNLSNAVIRGGSLTRVLVDGGRLTGVQFGETAVRDTVWRNVSADLAALRLAEFVRMTFESCDLREADFTSAHCDWVRFHDCDLRGAIFSKARFTNSEFRRCRLEGIEGVGNLGGTAMALDAVLALAPALANELGIALLQS